MRVKNLGQIVLGGKRNLLRFSVIGIVFENVYAPLEIFEEFVLTRNSAFQYSLIEIFFKNVSIKSFSFSLLIDIDLVTLIHVIVHDFDFSALVVQLSNALLQLCAVFVRYNVFVEIEIEHFVSAYGSKYLPMSIDVDGCALLAVILLAQPLLCEAYLFLIHVGKGIG
jgi:hypothetical protein